MTIDSDLEAIAEQIATYAKGGGVNFKDKLDSFRALTSYHFNKNNPKKPGKEEDDGTSFANFRERVEAASGIGESDPN